MQIIKWEPFKEIDRFFDDRAFMSLPQLPKLGFDLAQDVYEDEGHLVVKMSLPGLDSNNLEVKVEGEILTISGRREEDKESDTKDYYSKEIRRGAFSRSTHLPKSVDADKAEATYAQGVLTVTLPIVTGTKDKAVHLKITT